MIQNVLLAVYLGGLSVFDLKERAVPAVCLVPGIMGAFLKLAVSVGKGELLQGLTGLVPGLILLMIAIATKKAGCADGIVLGIIGVLEGYRGGMVIWGSSMFIMAFGAIALLCARKVNKQTQLPYLPFLTGGFFIWMTMGG